MNRGWIVAGALLWIVWPLSGCGSESEGSGSEPEAGFVEVSPSSWTVTEHCGRSFGLRNETARQRLFITPPTSFPEQGYPDGQIGDDWSGELEIGNRLHWGQCHDVLDDLETEQINEIWPATGGTVTVTTPVEIQSDGWATAPVSIIVRDLELQRPDGSLITIDELDITNDDWGFLGG